MVDTEMYWRPSSEDSLLGLGSIGGARSNSGSSNSANSGPHLTSSGEQQPFEPMDYARLSPSALDPASFSAQFVTPRFAMPQNQDYGGYGVAVADPAMCVFLPLPTLVCGNADHG